MELEEIKNFTYNVEREILEFDYSLVGDPKILTETFLLKKKYLKITIPFLQAPLGMMMKVIMK